MFGSKTAAFFLSVLACIPGHAQAQQVLVPGSLMLSGYRATCGPVQTVIQPINDIAQSQGDHIFLSPRVFGLPRAQQMFWYTHECGHQMFGASESVADCWAVQQGKIQGWLTPDELVKLTRSMQAFPGDTTHLAGPARILYIDRCYAS